MRLTQSEIVEIQEDGKVEEVTEFPNGSSLTYRIQKSNEFNCELSDNIVSVSLNTEAINEWADSDQVSLGGELDLEKGSKLSILVEKDFKCLTVRPEDETDMFPNPQKHHC